MKKMFLTCLLGLGLSPALFANYSSYGPTQITPGVGGAYVNCLNIYFATLCVEYVGPHTIPTRGDVINIWSNGVLLGTATIQSYVGPTPPTPPSDGNPKNPDPQTGTFQVGTISQSQSQSNF